MTGTGTASRLLLVAHDPGPADLLACIAPQLASLGLAVDAHAAGPAATILAQAGVPVTAPSDGVEAATASLRQRPCALVLTGTSFGLDLDADYWRAAARLGIPSLALMDSWVNLDRRFRLKVAGTPCHPGHISAITDEQAAQLAALPGMGARIHVCGQPFVRQQLKALRDARAARPATGPTLDLAFFSEPTRQSGFAATQGYDQFDAAAGLLAALAAHSGWHLTIQPHPREERADWERWLPGRPGADHVTIGDWQNAFKILAKADAAAGSTSMLLVMAAAAGMPVVSLQPRRTMIVNPILEDNLAVAVVTDERHGQSAIGNWLDQARMPTHIAGPVDLGPADAADRIARLAKSLAVSTTTPAPPTGGATRNSVRAISV